MPFLRHRHILALATLTVFSLSACTSEQEVEDKIEAPRFVKLAKVSHAPAFDEFPFPAVVSAVKTVDPESNFVGT